jgi:hypothetical protein
VLSAVSKDSKGLLPLLKKNFTFKYAREDGHHKKETDQRETCVVYSPFLWEMFAREIFWIPKSVFFFLRISNSVHHIKMHDPYFVVIEKYALK